MVHGDSRLFMTILPRPDPVCTLASTLVCAISSLIPAHVISRRHDPLYCTFIQHILTNLSRSSFFFFPHHYYARIRSITSVSVRRFSFWGIPKGQVSFFLLLFFCRLRKTFRFLSVWIPNQRNPFIILASFFTSPVACFFFHNSHRPSDPPVSFLTKTTPPPMVM